MRKLKLMADYECHPLWEIFEDGLENIDPNTLGLSRDLDESLDQWAREYDASLNTNDPLNSGFTSEEAENNFESEGKRLFEDLKEQLCSEWVITYYSRKESKLYT
jgi:aryl-alcohol dehydrogenase-like predicted oxidoreductase